MNRCSLEPAHPLDDEDLLEEILLRLPPHPSSLPRASLVCKRWQNMLSDRQFLHRFRKHHHKPPMLGFFTGPVAAKPVFFTCMLDSPNCIPPSRFSVPQNSPSDLWKFMGCRHGLAILINDYMREVIVWDPLTGQHHRVPFLPWVYNAQNERMWHAAVLCDDAEDGHVHGDCFSSQCKVVLICDGGDRKSAWLYESVFGVWRNIASIENAYPILVTRPSILIENTLYWLFYAGNILVCDIDRHTLEVIQKPANIHHTNCWSFQICRTNEDSALHLAVVSELSIQIWKRKSCSDGVLGWVLLQKNNQLEGLLSRGVPEYSKRAVIVGYDEVSNVIALTTYIGDFTLQLDLMRFERISEIRNCWNSYMIYYPYRNYYTADNSSVPHV